MLRLMIWLLLLYVVARTAGNVMKVVRGYNAKKSGEVKPPKQPKYTIRNDDVIDAKFEDIDSKNHSNQK